MIEKLEEKQLGITLDYDETSSILALLNAAISGFLSLPSVLPSHEKIRIYKLSERFKQLLEAY